MHPGVDDAEEVAFGILEDDVVGPELLGQIGEAINSETLMRVSERTSWVLPFEALYQDGLYRITSETIGPSSLVPTSCHPISPFGG